MADASRLIHQLSASKEYAALQALRPEFNLFGLLDDALREPAWSRLFSGVLDSTRPHGLGNKGLRDWLTLVDEELETKGNQLPVAFRQVPSDAIVRSRVEYTTPKKRRVDVLVRILDAKHRVTAVIGIENKLYSPEQPAQIADYQAAVTEVFPNADQLILYLTPNGKEALTASASAPCPYRPVSYRTMVKTCQSLCAGAGPKVALLLESLCSEIESTVLGETKMEKEAKALIRQLWEDPDNRKAMRLIIECIPTHRKLWETDLFERVKTRLGALGVELAKEESPISFYPIGSERPREIKFRCGGKVGEVAKQAEFVYMQDCSDKSPVSGSEFVLRLCAWCKPDSAQQLVKNMKLQNEFPESGSLRRPWQSWVNVWTGGSYMLGDDDKLNVESMADLLLGGVGLTWPVLARKIGKLGK
jgi:hypothetical protein